MYIIVLVSDIAIFVLKRDVKLQLTNIIVLSCLLNCWCSFVVLWSLQHVVT